jgi:hypothetical protein
MRALTEEVTVTTAAGKRRDFERLPDPLFRLNDPARQYADGTIWAWGRSGRPAALLTLAKEKTPTGGFNWLHELASLAPVAISMTRKGDWTWTPSGPGIEMRPIPKAPAPGADEARRLRQMKEIVRRFKAFEFLGARYELRDRSPLLRKLGQGCSIASHESEGTEVLPELSVLAGAVGCPRGAAEGARGHRRASPGAACRGAEGFLNLLQAAVL